MVDLAPSDSGPARGAAPSAIRSDSGLRLTGVGVGHRRGVSKQILTHRKEFDFLELIADNYFRNPQTLTALAASFPCVVHSLNLSVGSQLDDAYLTAVARVTEATGAPFHTDHLAFTRMDGRDLGHLAPIPYTEESLSRVVASVRQVMRVTNRPFALENIAMPFAYGHSTMDEWQFLREVVSRTGCGLLLDLENLRVNATNHGVDPRAYLNHLPLERVYQVHIAGGRHVDGVEHDTHSGPVPKGTWDLLQALCDIVPAPPVLLERDSRLDDFGEILADVRQARAMVSVRA